MKSEQNAVFSAGFFASVAVSSLLFLSAVAVPLVGSAAFLLAPLPVLYYSARIGRLRQLAALGTAVLVAAGAIRIIVPAAPLPVPLFILAFLGIPIMEFARRNSSVEKTVLFCVLLYGGCAAALIGYASVQTGKSPGALIDAYIAESLKESVEIYRQTGATSEQLTMLRTGMEEIATLLSRMYPALFCVMIAGTAWLNILMAWGLFRKNAIPVPGFGDLALWKAPEHLVWVFIVAGGALVIPVPEIRTVGLNLFIVCAFIYFLAGLAILGYVFRVKNVPSLIKVSGYTLVFAVKYVACIVAALGLFDLWVDFRKYIKPV